VRLDHLFTSLDSKAGVWSINYRIAEYSVVKKEFVLYNRMLWDDRLGVKRGSHAGDR